MNPNHSNIVGAAMALSLLTWRSHIRQCQVVPIGPFSLQILYHRTLCETYAGMPVINIHLGYGTFLACGASYLLLRLVFAFGFVSTNLFLNSNLASKLIIYTLSCFHTCILMLSQLVCSAPLFAILAYLNLSRNRLLITTFDHLFVF